MDLSEYDGWTARIRAFIAEHNFLIVRLISPQTKQTVFLRCYCCRTIPQLPEWTIGHFEIQHLSKDRWILLDIDNDISVKCSHVDIVDRFDLHRYLSVTKWSPTSQIQCG